MTKSRMIFIAVLLVAVAVLIWDKTANKESVSQPQAAQARPNRSTHRTAPAVGPKVSETNLAGAMDIPAHIPAELMKSEESYMIRKTRNIMQKLLWPPFDLSLSISDLSATRDLFRATAEYLAATQTDPPEPQSEPDPEDLLKKKIKKYWDKAREMKLSGTLIGENRSYAIINQDVLFEGDDIGPYQLVEVRSDAVILEIESVRIPLYLEE
jgi:hypothetical protein